MNHSTSKVVVEAKQVSKQVKSGDSTLSILHDINLTIHYAETIAIVGTSGSGKSTLLSLLAGLDLPTTGEIYLNGQDLTKLDEDGRASLRAGNIGFIFQSFHLFPSLTALENIMLPLELHHATAPAQKALELLDRVGLTARKHHYPRQLSGGEQQRIAIARAFATYPQILFADEITGNLDQKTGQHIIDLIFELNAEHNTTLVLVTHDPHLAEHCNRRLELENGSIRLC